MFDKLVDVLIIIWNYIVPCIVVDHYELGIRLRFGKNGGILQPGLHWKWPLADKILKTMIKMTTMPLQEQSFVTADGQPVIAKCIVKYNVCDIETLLLEAGDTIDAIADMTAGIVRNHMIVLPWEECNTKKTEVLITRKVQREGLKWGVNIHKVTIKDLIAAPTIRVFNSTDVGSSTEE